MTPPFSKIEARPRPSASVVTLVCTWPSAPWMPPSASCLSKISPWISTVTWLRR
jgi:hypothetical protein